MSFAAFPAGAPPSATSPSSTVCLGLRYPAWDKGREAVKLSTACTSKLVDFLLRVEQQHWTSTSVDLAGIPLEVELRGMSRVWPGRFDSPAWTRNGLRFTSSAEARSSSRPIRFGRHDRRIPRPWKSPPIPRRRPKQRALPTRCARRPPRKCPAARRRRASLHRPPRQ